MDLTRITGKFMKDINQLDETVFIPDEEYSLKKAWVTENVKCMGWRDNYFHQTIYNELSFNLGILDKVEQTRQKLTVESSKEIIKLLFILGYGTKQTAYWLWKWGYKGISLPVIKSYVRIRRRFWNEERDKFMKELEDAKDRVFQTMKSEVMAREKRTLELLLRNIDSLQDELENLHPVTNKAEYNATFNQIVKLEERCKSYHGLEQYRESYIEATTAIAIHKGKLEAEREPQKTIDVGASKPELME